MTPAGHLSISYITGRTTKSISLSAVLIGAIMPDLDFLFIFFDWFNQVHRVISHNLLYVAMFSIIGILVAPAGRKKAVGMGLLTGGIMHLFVDSVMDNNPSNGIGLALFWPFSNEFFSPFNILKAQNKFGWDEPLKMLRSLAPTMLYEVPFYLAALYLFCREKIKRAPITAEIRD